MYMLLVFLGSPDPLQPPFCGATAPSRTNLYPNFLQCDAFPGASQSNNFSGNANKEQIKNERNECFWLEKHQVTTSEVIKTTCQEKTKLWITLSVYSYSFIMISSVILYYYTLTWGILYSVIDSHFCSTEITAFDCIIINGSINFKHDFDSVLYDVIYIRNYFLC
jgi:hypothetical protein